MQLDRLKELKDKMVNAADFSDPWNYFFDHFGDKPEFMAFGEPVEDEMLKAVVVRLGRELFGDSVTMIGPMLMAVPKHDFLHGSCFLQGRLIVLFYFKDIDMGMISLADSPGGSGETLMVRFTSQRIDANKPVSFVPSPSDATH